MHPHSGFNKRREFARDSLLFDIRFGRWDLVVRRDPRLMAEIMPEITEPAPLRKQAIFYWIWMAGLMSRSPIWCFYSIFFQAFQMGIAMVRYLRGLPGFARHARVEEKDAEIKKRRWTGCLR
jgi:hypothetical protein